VLCSTGKETFFLTDRSQPNYHRLSSSGVKIWRPSHLIRKRCPIETLWDATQQQRRHAHKTAQHHIWIRLSA